MFILLAVKNDSYEKNDVRVMAFEPVEQDCREMLQYYEDTETWPESFEALMINTTIGVWFIT
jgi:hypothetical protein